MHIEKETQTNIDCEKVKETNIHREQRKRQKHLKAKETKTNIHREKEPTKEGEKVPKTERQRRMEKDRQTVEKTDRKIQNKR